MEFYLKDSARCEAPQDDRYQYALYTDLYIQTLVEWGDDWLDNT